MKSDRQIFHLLSFEGPDPYARAGGIATRVDGLARALAALGFETHLWFIGDPDLPASEHHGSLHLHRWCQWISRLSPAGVYVDEEGKRRDYAASLPPHLVSDYIVPAVARRARVTVVAEEWQTFHAVLHLDWLLRIEGLRQSADILWNANNVFGFDAIEWPRLKAAATVTTVSRYMRQRMWQHGVDALVVPNGLPPEAFRPVDRDAVARLRQQTRARVVLGKVARWDPDKRWLLAVDTVAELKRSGRRPLLIARGGLEAHGAEVLEHARTLALRVVERRQSGSGVAELVASTADLDDVDVLSLQAPLSADACRTLFRAADAVLVNSGHEPFGLVGLESMAVGGITCVGGTGEDYALAGWDALVLQSADPGELVRQYLRLESDPKQAAALRRRAAAAARRYSWDEVIRRNLLPYLGIAEPSPAATERRKLALVGHSSAATGEVPLAARAAE